MGGSSSNSSSFTAGNNSNSNSDNNTPRNSTATITGVSAYPGLRAQNNPNNRNTGVGIGVGSNSSRGLFSSINSSHSNSNGNGGSGLPSHSTPSHNNTPYVFSPPLHTRSSMVVQGSNVNVNINTNVSAMATSPQGPAMPTAPGRTSTRSRTPSVASTTFPTPHTPYVQTNNRSSAVTTSFTRSSTNTSSSTSSRSSVNNSSSNTTTRSSNNIRSSSSSSSVDINLTTNSVTSRTGAYSVTRSSGGGSPQVYRVTVPVGVVPGNEFTVHAGNRRVRVRCPTTSRPGHSLQITLPPEPVTTHKLLTASPLTRACKIGASPKLTAASSVDPFMRQNSIGTGGAEDMSPEVRSVNMNAAFGGTTPKTFLVTIPADIHPGMTFNVNAEGQKFKVTCPPNAGPNSKVRIVAPTGGGGGPNNPPNEEPEPHAAPKMQIYEVLVPQGVRPNQPFTLMANNQRVLVTCPPNVVPGQKIRFQLPVPVANTKKTSIMLSYKDDAGSKGWERTIRVTDMKFQWIRVVEKDSDGGGGGCEKKGDDLLSSTNSNQSTGVRAVEDMEAFDFSKAAYVRKIQYLEGNDARMRTGIVSLVPAQEAVVDSKCIDHNYHGTTQSKTLFQYTDIANIQSKSLDEKVEWFHKSVCEELYTPWEQGHVKIVVKRSTLLDDSVNAVMSLGRDDMRKRWRIEFSGEPGIEAGGLTREWFQLVTEQIFDPDFGLWLSSVNNQMSMQINPASHISCPDDYLKFFRFLGRIMGRALFDRQLIKGHMVRHLYKHLLGWPVTFDDLEAQDEEYYTALKKFITMEDLSIMCLDFTVTEETLGVRKDIELIPGGDTKEVTSENLPEYLEANLKYRMLNRCKPQITELMLGFFDVIPEPALTVFDPNELELILCGLPTIDMNDWMDNTKYSGYYESKGKNHQVVDWFWEVVEHDFDQEMKARLLQFVTGTSGVPPRGFSVLQGNDGNIKKFCVHGVSRDQYCYPRAHTCFNRIDLPNYSSKRELRERVGQAVSMTYVGFDME